MGFSRQEYWSGVPLPSLCKVISLQLKQIKKIKSSGKKKRNEAVFKGCFPSLGAPGGGVPRHRGYPEPERGTFGGASVGQVGSEFIKCPSPTQLHFLAPLSTHQPQAYLQLTGTL